MRRLVTLLTVALAGCATVTTLPQESFLPSPEDVAKVVVGELGAIVVDLGLEQPCDVLRVEYRNFATSTTVSKVLSEAYSEETGTLNPGRVPVVLPVPPGRYALTGGACVSIGSSYTYRIDLEPLALWLRSFEVEAGKVIYAGTPHRERYGREFGIALNDMEKMSGRKIRSSDFYMLYDVRDDSARVHAEVARLNPQLAPFFVSRLTTTLMDKETVRKIVNDAYDTEAPGVAPDDATAARNRKAAQQKVREGLRNYLDALIASLKAEEQDRSSDTFAPADVI